MSHGLIHLLARLYPWPVETRDELDRALAYLDWSIEPESIVRAGYGGATAIVLSGLVVVALDPLGSRLAVSSSLVGLCLGVAYAIPRVPVLLAVVRRTTALGEAPDLVARAVLRMRLVPTAEAAAVFAAEADEGPLAASLAEHVRRAAGTSRTGLAEFAAEWADWHPTLRRSILLIDAAADAPPAQRERTLERAQSAILDGTRRELARFAGEIRGPATGLYAFGVLLPLALVAVLPAARAAGVGLTLPVIAAIYDVVLPATLLGASAWLLVRRPVAFPPPRVTRDHPAVAHRRRWATAVGCLGVGLFVRVVVRWLGLPGWVQTIVPVGATLGLLLVGWYYPFVSVRARTREIESGLPDALYLVGRRVQEGHSVEVATGRAADELAGPTGAVLDDASRIMRQLRADVSEAFLGEHGALTTVPSVRARSTAALVSIAAEEGRPAGTTIVALADHLDELLEVERAAHRELATVVDTMESTAMLFGPGVAGATLALAGGLSRESAVAVATAPIPLDGLGVVIGVYVLALSALLTALAVGLQHGHDRSIVGYRVGTALLAATLVYPVTFVGASALV